MAKRREKGEKVFVLDTNVLVHDPEAIFKFPRHQIVIPLTVLEELDNLKRSTGDLGKNVRTAIRYLIEAKKTCRGNLNTGVMLPSNTLLRISTEMKKDFEIFEPSSNDNKILLTAFTPNPSVAEIFVIRDL